MEVKLAVTTLIKNRFHYLICYRCVKENLIDESPFFCRIASLRIIAKSFALEPLGNEAVSAAYQAAVLFRGSITLTLARAKAGTSLKLEGERAQASARLLRVRFAAFRRLIAETESYA